MNVKKLVLVTTAFIFVLSISGWFLWWSSQASIPPDILKQLPFSPLSFQRGEGYSSGSYKYSPDDKLLSFILKSNDNNIIITEQPQPPQFTEIPEYKDKFLDNVVKRYSNVQSANGVIYLTRPPKQTKQVGVIIDKGLLIFMSSDKDLSEDQWRKIVDHFELERT